MSEQRLTLTLNVRARLSVWGRVRMVMHTIATGHWSWTLHTVKKVEGEVVLVCNACGKRIKVGAVTVGSSR